ncbi:unnamed protein product, partial [Brachionus calyciflorus]
VNDLESFFNWTTQELIPLLKSSDLDYKHADASYNIFFKSFYHKNLFVFKSIRFSQILTNDEYYEDEDFYMDYEQKNPNNLFKYKQTKFYDKFYHRGLKRDYHHALSYHFKLYANDSLSFSNITNQTYILILEMNLFNIDTRVWTIVKTSIEIESDKIFKKQLIMRNLKETFFIKQKWEKIQPIIFFFLFMISLYILNEGYQLNSMIEKSGFIKGCVLYVTSLDNILDQCLVFSSIFYISNLAYNRFAFNVINSQLLKIDSDYYTFDFFVNCEKNIQIQCNFMIFIAFLKALSLLNFNPKTYLITETIRKGFLDLILLILFVVFNYVLFAGIGYVLFKSDRQFEDFRTAFYTSVLSIVKHVDFDHLIKENFSGLFMWQIIGYFYMQRTLINFVISVILSYFDQIRYTHKKTQIEETFYRMVKNAGDYFKISKNKK